MAFMLETGIIMLHAETAQDLHDMILRAFIIAEKTDVHIPVGVFVDGFFVTHTRDVVEMAPAENKLPPYDPYSAPVPVMDMENVPFRQMRDPFVMKSNYVSYAAHASWQQEVMAAGERARKYIDEYLDGLIEIENPNAEIMLISSGTAVSQCREAMAIVRSQGIDAGLVKIKSIRPFPDAQIQEIVKRVKVAIVPEFNRAGWLAKEIKSVVEDTTKVVAGPRVYGGMTMPLEMIIEEIRRCTG
jgi:pyruvate ferredoxin oxidoreductase alpha subunit